MAIKEVPVDRRTYYKNFITNSKEKLESLKDRKEELIYEIKAEHASIDESKETYKTVYKIDLDEYSEYKNNAYSKGTFLKITKGMFMNKSNDYELVSDVFALYNLANKQKEIHDIDNKIALLTKLVDITINDYTEILRTYFTIVHKKLILEGCGYYFGKHIGWTCVVRCTIAKQRKKLLDFNATKLREKELIAQGKRIYNAEEAAWCKKNGIEYKAEDKRVYRNDEFCYQVPLINCRLPKGDDMQLKMANYRSRELRGISMDKFIDMANADTGKICELPIDLKTKIILCDKVDKLLYRKYIRNENQKPFTFKSSNWKNR
uniref:Uncharacterized protein n=1 Tax=Geladintestivirus 2 TaxID=3233134 RepID=A0AAU8MKF6_9CAUD